MKILFVTPALSYPNARYAGELITFKLIEELKKRGHEIFLISGLRPGDKNHLTELGSYCTILDAIEVPWTYSQIVREIIKWTASGFKYGLTFRKKVALSVSRHIKENEFDIIQVEHTETGSYISVPSNIPAIIHAHDVLLKPAMRQYKMAKGLRRAWLFMKFLRIKTIELRIYKKFRKILVKSEFDKDLLSFYNKELDISVLKPYVKMNESKDNDEKIRESAAILFMGAMDRYANILAVNYFYSKIFPSVKEKIPLSKFYIVGNNPPHEIVNIGKQDKSVVVTGYVKDLDSFLKTGTIFVAPMLIGGGVIIKILDAMAYGLPVVSTSIGNEGIKALPDAEIFLADNPVDFANKIIRLINNPGLRDQISLNAKKFVSSKFNWADSVDEIENEYGKLIN